MDDRESDPRRLLISWREVADSRNARIRAAGRMGLSVAEMARLTGLARTTISRILKQGGNQ